MGKKVMGMQKMPTGVDNFRILREKNYYFVDKTYFIKEILDNQVPVTLITRPRRFGKTLLLSMLKEFFDINAAGSRLFDGLSIARAGEAYTGHQGKYPVIFMSMKSAALGKLENTLGMIRWILSDLYGTHIYLLKSDLLDENEKEYYKRVYARDIALQEQDLAKALSKLSLFLYKH